MTVSILGLALAYAFLALLLLMAILRSELRAGFKLLLVAASLGFYLWHYHAMQAYLGWPAGNRLPARFELISRVTVEPDLKRDEEGGIYLWLRDLEREQLIPRAYRLPYDKALHQKVENTLRRQQRGERIVGRPASGGSGARPDIEFEAVKRDTGELKSRSD